MRKSKRDSHILSIGRIEIDQKGLDLLLDAFGRAEIDSKVKLVIAGNGEKKEISKLQGKIKELNLESRVKLAGRVSGKRKTKLFEDCMFVVLPSRYETQSLVALEAISCGAALVCFDIDGNKWLPDNICAKVKAFKVAELSHTMEELVKDFGKRNRLGVGAKEFAKIYSWDKVAKRYEQYLLTLTNKA